MVRPDLVMADPGGVVTGDFELDIASTSAEGNVVNAVHDLTVKVEASNLRPR